MPGRAEAQVMRLACLYALGDATPEIEVDHSGPRSSYRVRDVLAPVSPTVYDDFTGHAEA